MKYLTKQWYELCQQTNMHFNMKANIKSKVYDEAFYLLLYKMKENEFISEQRKIYNINPRFMLDMNGSEFVLADKFIAGEEISDNDKVIYKMEDEEKMQIQKMMDQYNSRLPFDENEWKERFDNIQKMKQEKVKLNIPLEIYNRIADIRVFALGYCTKEILEELKKLSENNQNKVDKIIRECSYALKKEDIPIEIKEKFCFHDCEIKELIIGKNIIIKLNSDGGFTDNNIISFISPRIIRQDENIKGSILLYEELYRVGNDYEAHMLFSNGETMPELILHCSDIIIEKE